MSHSISAFPNIFVTVGTTDFNQLIQEINSDAFIDLMEKLSCKYLNIQIGRGTLEPTYLQDECNRRKNIVCNIYRFKPNLDHDMKTADLIITHCGAGSIIESLSLEKLFIVVVNDSLQGNHQDELAIALSNSSESLTTTESYCISTCPSRLLIELNSLITTDKMKTLKKFPKPDFSLFPYHIDNMFEFR